MTARAQLALDAAALEPGTSVRMVCPFCGGGRSREPCMVLTHGDDGALLFVCHRAHCGASGRLGGGPVLRRPDRRETVVRPYDGPRFAIPEDVAAAVQERWHFNVSLPDTWCWSGSRLMMPIRGPLHEHRGWIGRALDDRKPKVLTYREAVDCAFIHWAGDRARQTIVVVEDIPSAERLARLHYRGVALLGTHMDDLAQREIVGEALRNDVRVLVALDRDAARKTLAYTEALRWHVPAAAVLLTHDVKDMADGGIHACMNAA